jgi:4-amino-4-deoxy-L-arabinose transferase-like glycosyltransferase
MLILIICLGALVRLLYACSVPNVYAEWPDSQNYVSIAQNLATHFQFSNSWPSDRLKAGDAPLIDMGDIGPTSFREPLYPLLLALKFKLLGDSARTTFIIQALLETLSIPLCFGVAAMLVSPRAALLAAFFESINPYHIYYASVVATENLSTLILLSMILVTLRVLKIINAGTPVPRNKILLLALVSSAGILTHSVMVFTVLVTVIFLSGACYYRYGTAGPAVRMLGMLGLLTVVFVSPWFVRNYLLWDKVVYNTAEGRTLMDGFNDLATGGNEFTVTSKLTRALVPYHFNEVERSDIYRRNALTWIRDHPRRAIYLVIKKQLLFWSPVPLYVGGYERLLGAAWGIPFLSLSLIGVLCINSGSVNVRYVLTAIVCFSLVYSLAIAATRYRLPLESVLTVFAALGSTTLLRRWWPDSLEPADTPST